MKGTVMAAVARATRLVLLQGPASPLRTIEEMEDAVFKQPTNEDRRRARKVIESLTDFQRTLIVRVVDEKESLEAVASSLHMKETRARKVFMDGLDRLCKGRGVEAIRTILYRAKRLGFGSSSVGEEEVGDQDFK